MKVIHILDGLHFAGIESLCLTLIKSFPESLDQSLLNLNKTAQARRTHVDQLLSCGHLSTYSQFDSPSYLSLFWQVFQYIKVYKPDAVIVYPLNIGTVFIAAAVFLQPRTRLFTTLQNTCPCDLVSRLKWFLIFLFLSCLRAKCIPCSHTVLASLPFIIPRLFTPVIHNPAPVQTIASSKNLLKSSHSPISPVKILSVARLDRIKDHETLLAAYALLNQSHCTLTIVGDGPDRDKLSCFALSLGLNPSDIFAGTRSDIHEILHQFDIFVLSTTPSEGFGIVLAEAMAASLAIVASDVPACREVLLDGSAGLLVESGSSQALSEALRSLIYNTSLRDTYSRMAFAAAKYYDSEYISTLWYSCILNKP